MPRPLFSREQFLQAAEALVRGIEPLGCFLQSWSDFMGVIAI
jgi:hypothetical protein